MEKENRDLVERIALCSREIREIEDLLNPGLLQDNILYERLGGLYLERRELLDRYEVKYGV